MTAQTYRARITVRLNAGVNDPQGNTVRDGLHALGFGTVRDVRVGKTIDLVLDASDEAAAGAEIDQMCQRLLANPVIEDFEVQLEPGGEG